MTKEIIESIPRADQVITGSRSLEGGNEFWDKARFTGHLKAQGSGTFHEFAGGCRAPKYVSPKNSTEYGVR